jgi:glycosyltransferase involved in cell wall biosynthesis
MTVASRSNRGDRSRDQVGQRRPVSTRPPLLSVVVAVRDAEDTVARDVRALALHLRRRGLCFEILAVSDGSRDTSVTMLRLLSNEVPELVILGSARPGRAFKHAVVHASGEVVLLWESDRGAPVPHAVLGWALGRLARRAAVVMRGRFLIAHRLRALPALLAVAGRGDDYEIRFERQAAGLGIDLDVVGQRQRRRTLLSPVLRILSA